MKYSEFTAICKKLGDQNLPEAERWKSIKYINISGQAIPGFDFQKLLSEGLINLVTKEDIGPGFVILDMPNSDMGVENLQTPTITFIPIDSIDALTFLVTKKPITNTYDMTINEILSHVITDGGDLLTTVQFMHSIYYFKIGDLIKFDVKFGRELTESDYNLKYYDNLGNELTSKPTKVGRYSVKIICTNGYTGEGSAIFEIQPK